jgi:predicted nucleotidyltransferase
MTITQKPLVDFEKLNQVFRQYADIQAVYLFGSLASGRTHSESDLDLAIVPRTHTLRERKINILANLIGCVRCHIDLVFLDTDDVVLKYEAVRQNRVIYQTDDFDQGSYYSKVVREYFDFEPYLDVQQAALKRRILGTSDESDSETA